MRSTYGFKIFFLGLGILFTSLSILSFNHSFVYRAIGFLSIEPFLAAKAIKYVVLHRLFYLGFGAILIFLPFSSMYPAWQVRLYNIRSFLDFYAEKVSFSFAGIFKYPLLQAISKHQLRILFSGLFLSLIFMLILSWQDAGLILGRFLYDDTYCYLKVARNIVSGNGPTFDGVNPTNGFHPLWMLFSIALEFLFRSYPNMPLHLLLSMSSVLHILTAYYIYKLISNFGYVKLGVMAALFWALNYNIISIALCGVETPLFAFLLIFTLYTYLKWRQNLTLLRTLGAGVLVSFVVLARFDGFLFLMFLFIDYLISQRENIYNALWRVMIMSAVFLLFVLPWAAWSYHSVGSILPITFYAKSAFENFFPGDIFFISSLKRFLLQLGWFHYALRGYLRIIGATFLWGKLIWVILLVIVLPSLKSVWRGIKPIGIFILYALAHFSYYILILPVVRYTYPSLIIFLVAAALIFGHNATFLKRKAELLSIVLSALSICVAGDSISAWKQGRAGTEQHSLHATMYYDVTNWIQQNTSTEAVVGSFNSGIYGYYSRRRVVNLDGFINNSAFYAIRDKNLFNYMRCQGVSYLVDWNQEDIKGWFKKAGNEEDFKRHSVLLDTIEQKWGPYKGKKVYIYKITY